MKMGRKLQLKDRFFFQTYFLVQFLCYLQETSKHEDAEILKVHEGG